MIHVTCAEYLKYFGRLEMLLEIVSHIHIILFLSLWRSETDVE